MSLGGSRQKVLRPLGPLHRAQPLFHHDLDGIPKMIIGNAFNKLGEFSCVTMPLIAQKLFG
jgi:hypothetical protein